MDLETTARMPSTLVTCPESGRLEAIDYEDDDLGTLIVSCSAACAVGCSRMCAATLDRRRYTRGFAGLDAAGDTLFQLRH